MRRLAELHAAIAATHRLDQSVLDQRLENLEQEQFGYRVGGRDLGDAAQPVLVRRAIHEDAHGVVGLTREPHECLVSLNSMNMAHSLEQFQTGLREI